MRIIIKVGTSVIAPKGRIDTNQLRNLVDQFDLSRHEYLIVSSGAIASGMSRLSLAERPTGVPLMQACAAVGQSLLMHTYEQLFFGKKVVAQLLLSDRKSTRLNSSHSQISYAVFCLKKKNERRLGLGRRYVRYFVSRSRQRRRGGIVQRLRYAPWGRSL